VNDQAPIARDALATRLRKHLVSYRNVREVRMFGGLAFMVDERMAVSAARGGDLLVRTDPSRYDDLLQQGGVPAQMSADRPMGRGWLSVPAEQIREDERLLFWLNVGLDSGKASS
jgi:hypothetical protein